MRYVPFEKLKPEMVVALDMFRMSGKRYLTKGAILTVPEINMLRPLGIRGLYITDKLTNDITIDSLVSTSNRQQIMQAIYECDVAQCEKYAVAIYKGLRTYSDVILDYIDVRLEDEYDYAHSVQVAIYCAVIGVRLHMSGKDIVSLVTAALLHDIGKRNLSKEIAKKNSRLSQEEYLKMKLHPSDGVKILSKKVGFTEDMKTAIMQHHENEDGSGYPNGLSSEAISPWAKIIHVADVYDALTAKRPFKAAYSTIEAKEYLLGGRDILFDAQVVDCFVECIPNYPKGTEVTLSNEKHAVVQRNLMNQKDFPIVVSEDGEIINLAKSIDLHIVEAEDEHADFRIEDSEKKREIMVKGLKNYRVMAVDDQKTNLSLLREILDDYYELTLLKSGEQALRFLEEYTLPDLILMDINMPDMDGIETARKIQEMTHGVVPILFVSSNTDTKTVLACRELNCVGYIVRPYNAVYIKSQIKRILMGEP